MIKKINLVKDLKRMGFDTSQIYCENLTQPKAFEINQRFKELTTADILKEVKKKLLNVEKEYTQNETVQTWDLENEIDSVIESFGSEEGIGRKETGRRRRCILIFGNKSVKCSKKMFFFKDLSLKLFD